MLKEQLEARRRAAFDRVQDESKHEAKAKEVCFLKRRFVTCFFNTLNLHLLDNP